MILNVFPLHLAEILNDDNFILAQRTSVRMGMRNGHALGSHQHQCLLLHLGWCHGLIHCIRLLGF